MKLYASYIEISDCAMGNRFIDKTLYASLGDILNRDGYNNRNGELDMISKEMEQALNDQVQKEFYSAALYLSMSAYCSSLDLNGFANWFRIQSMEEMSHAMKLYDYIIEQDGRAVIPAIEQPPVEFKSAQDTFAGAFEHEQKVTKWINELTDLAIEQKDHATRNFLSWFVTEQVEEEANARDILNKVKMLGGQGHGLFMLDRELGQRVFTPPATNE